MTARTGGRTVGLLLLGLLLVPAVEAFAEWRASTAGALVATSGTWAVVATATDADPSGPLQLPQVRRNAPAHFRTVNTGTLPLVAATYRVTARNPVTLEACAEPWAADTCPGGAVLVPLDQPTTAVPTAPGDVLHLRLSVSTPQRTDVSVAVVVSTDGVRSPVQTTS